MRWIYELILKTDDSLFSGELVMDLKSPEVDVQHKALERADCYVAALDEPCSTKVNKTTINTKPPLPPPLVKTHTHTSHPSTVGLLCLLSVLLTMFMPLMSRWVKTTHTAKPATLCWVVYLFIFAHVKRHKAIHSTNIFFNPPPPCFTGPAEWKSRWAEYLVAASTELLHNLSRRISPISCIKWPFPLSLSFFRWCSDCFVHYKVLDIQPPLFSRFVTGHMSQWEERRGTRCVVSHSHTAAHILVCRGFSPLSNCCYWGVYYGSEEVNDWTRVVYFCWFVFLKASLNV